MNDNTGDLAKERWYAKHIRPRFVNIHTLAVEQIKDYLQSPLQDVDEISKSSFFGVDASLFQEAAGMTNNKLASRMLRRNLSDHGFCVITQALTFNECNHALSLAWDYIEASSLAEEYLIRSKRQNDSNDMHDGKSKTSCNETTSSRRDKEVEPAHYVPISRHDPSTHSSELFPRSLEGGILPFYGSGHSTFAWYLRSHPAVVSIFSQLYGTTDLISSLDGIILWMETKVHELGSGDEDDTINDIDDGGWFHLDQNPITKPNFEAVQGLVNLIPVTESSGGNVLVSGSHKMFPQHYLGGIAEDDLHNEVKEGRNEQYEQRETKKEHTTSQQDCQRFYQDRLKWLNGDDWLEINPSDDIILTPEHVVMCGLGYGDVLIWDSRVVHCSYRGKERILKAKDTDQTSISSMTSTNQPMSKGTCSCSYNCRVPIASEQPSSSTKTIEVDEQVQKAQNESVPHSYGLKRAASLVSMMPRSACSLAAQRERVECTNSSFRTLTHWANKVSPLGEERSDEVVQEEMAVNFIRNLYQGDEVNNYKDEDKTSSSMHRTQVLLSYDELTGPMRQLV